MAKDNQTEDKVVFETMPGADPISEEESKPFEVDMNFETTEEDDEVEFPKEEEIEEVEQLKAEEEPVEELEEEAETEELEATDEVAEDSGEETVLAEDDANTQQPEGRVPEEVDEPKEPMIPKSRFDEVLAKQKALAKKLEEATNPVQTISEAPEYDFDAKEVEYQEHVLNGEAQKATSLRKEIRKAEKEQMMFEVQSQMGRTVEQSTEVMALQTKAAELATKYPELNETHTSFDEVKTQEVLDLRDAFMVQGFSGADALDKASKYIMGSPVVEPVAPKIDPQIAQKKKTANTTKKLQAAESQPPALKGKNKVEKKVDVDLLSADEFNALPDETLRRMRGDFG